MKDHAAKLDALRGMAAIVVLLAHAGQIFLWRLLGEHSTFAVLSGNAARHAVLVFFLLSGYLITGSIIANAKRGFSVGEYLAARITRIYPPLVGAVLVTVTVCWLLRGQTFGPAAEVYRVRPPLMAPNLREVVNALLMADGLLDANGPLWTLYVEVHLYLVAGLVALAWSYRSWLAAAAAAVLLTFYLQQTPEFALFAGVWGLGAVAAVFPDQMRAVSVLAWLAGAGLLAAGIADPALLSIDNPDSGGLAQLAFSLVYLELIFLRRLGSAPPRWMVGTARYSYSLYVLHFPLLLGALWLCKPYVGTLGASIAAAALSAAGCVVVAACFASVAEDQTRFKPAIRRALGLAPAVERVRGDNREMEVVR